MRLDLQPVPPVGAHDLLIAVSAVSLNYKDKLIVEGKLIPDLAFPYVPASDFSGQVVEIGSAVTRFRVGDRVLGQVIADWIDGDAPAVLHQKTLAMTAPGVLSQYVVIDENAAVAAPASLSDVEASTLPIAALTAWSALIEQTRHLPGQTIVVEGTGGVSLFALQFARAFGLRAIVTSSSDEKLARAKELGAWHGINYRSHPNWGTAVRSLTGEGAAHVLEVVGGANVLEAAEAVASDGVISVIGILGGTQFTLPIVAFMRRRLRIQGVSVGSRRAFERMTRAIDVAGIKPVIDSVFPFGEAADAFHRLSQSPFGKVVIAS